MSGATRLRVLLDHGPLVDTRRDAGIGRYVARLSEALGRREDVEVVVARPPSPPLRDSWTVRWLNAQPAVTAGFLGHRPDLVHGMASDAAAFVPAARQVVTVHDVVPWSPERSRPGSPTRVWLAYQRRRLPRCAAIIAVSPSVAADVAAVLGVDSQRIHVVPHGVEPVFTATEEADDAARRTACGVAAAPYVLWVGSLRYPDPRKALDVLVAAVGGIDEGHPPPLLVLAGATGPEARRVAELARRSGVPTVCCGFVDDATLAALYRGAAAVAVPSRHEGFGLPALEAMACGAPLVVARAGHLAHLAGDAALVVEPGDVRELRHALARLLDDPRLRTRLGEAGRRRAAGATWDRSAALTVEVYRRAVARRRGGLPGP